MSGTRPIASTVLPGAGPSCEGDDCLPVPDAVDAEEAGGGGRCPTGP